jgi:hypothetical protein
LLGYFLVDSWRLASCYPVPLGNRPYTHLLWNDWVVIFFSIYNDNVDLWISALRASWWIIKLAI